MRLIATFGIISCLSATAATNPPQVTFTKDVAPVLAKNCQSCHRPGEAAPMSFLTYQQTRPWAKAIREAVLLKKMPPWFAEPEHGHFSNDRSLTKDEIGTLVQWAEAPEGNTKDRPAPRHWTAGWNIDQPDTVIEMPQPLPIPAAGDVEYQYV